jgi:glycosyltransferase involved in cell wall biosynthesis
MKVLLSAYSCEPGKGSERGVGWNVVREIARYHEVWVLTRPDESKAAIEAELARNPVPNLHFVYFTLPLLGGLWRLGSSGAMQIHYYLWQIQAYFVARQLHQEIGFDVAHHVTFVKYSTPSFLSLLPIPFIWGPVGGGESAPAPFWKDFGWRARLYELARDAVRRLGEADPFVHLTARRSAVVRATTEDTAKCLYRMGVSSVQIVSESGLSKVEIERLGQFELSERSPLRFISIGRLLHWKGFHLGLQAFAAANLPDAEYWIVGDGAESDRLHQLAEQLQITDRVKFWGQLDREEVLMRLGEAQVLVHPSLHDSGGWVCLEAMAAGRPVLCLNLGGPSVQVTEETGIRVAAQEPEQVVQDLATAMRRLAFDAPLRVRMGKAGRQRVQHHFTWEVSGKQVNQLYTTLLKQEERCIS